MYYNIYVLATPRELAGKRNKEFINECVNNEFLKGGVK